MPTHPTLPIRRLDPHAIRPTDPIRLYRLSVTVRYSPLQSVTIRYRPLQSVTVRYSPLHLPREIILRSHHQAGDVGAIGCVVVGEKQGMCMACIHVHADAV